MVLAGSIHGARSRRAKNGVQAVREVSLKQEGQGVVQVVGGGSLKQAQEAITWYKGFS